MFFTIRHKRYATWFVLLITLTLAGCSPLIKIEQPARTDFSSLAPGSTVGQTFVARYDGLEGVVLFLKPGQASQGTLSLHLRSGPQSTDDLAVASLPLQNVDSAGFYRFQFPPITDSQNRYYYASLSLDEAATSGAAVQVGSASAGSYLNGSAYQDASPGDSQLTFRLVYDPGRALTGVLGQALDWLVWLVAGLFLFVLPGWALISLLWTGWKGLRWEEKLGLAGGVSLAIYPLLFLWTSLVHLHLGALYAWIPPVLGIGLLGWQNRHRLRRLRAGGRNPLLVDNPSQKARSRGSLVEILPSLALLGVVGLVFGVRFWAVRDLDLPMWGDSYQHTMIAQLLVDNGGLFSSWQPYADLQSFTYHFGFHTLTAVFHWVTGLALPQATLWTGQILNGLAVLSLYPLATSIGRSRWAGVAAVLVAGLLAPMPMFYVNWGRFTQLAGQVILLSVVYLAWRLFESEQTDWRLTGLVWVAFSGLALTHFRVLIYGVVFVAAYLLLNLFKGQLWTLIKRILWVGLGAGLLFLPWFLHVFGGEILVIFAHQVTTPAGQTTGFVQEYNAIGSLFTYLPPWQWLLFLPVVGWGLWRQEKGAALVSLWWFLLLVLANPQWLRLPGAGAISNFAVFIAAYIPAGVLLGAATGWLLETASVQSSARRLAFSTTLLVIFIAAGLWGARQRRNDVNPGEFSLATRPDIRAAAWIKENTPKNAGFLVNSFFAYGGTVIAGSDGGWWLPLLADRSTNLPPLSYGFERDPWPGYKEWVHSLPAELLDKGIDDPQVLAMLDERNLDYIYVGQLQGRVNYAGPYPLAPQVLLDSPNFQPVYHQDRVWIFKRIPAGS